MSYFKKVYPLFDPSNLSVFGTLETNQLTPIVEIDFTYGINSQLGTGSVLNSGIADTNASSLRLQSGTNAAGSALFNSRRLAKYRPGQGMVARFSTVFGTAQASNTQISGSGTSTDGYFFGYNGTAFGLMLRNNGSDTWVTQANWNGDKCDGTGASKFTINPQLGNVYMIKYPYLGYGDINYFIMDSVTSRWILVHTIQYANFSASTQVSNPDLFFYAQNLNTGNTTNVTMYVGSVGIFLSGVRSYASSPKWAIDNSKTTITTETNIISIKNATTVNGVTNRGLIRINFCAVGADAGKNTVATGTFRFRINATLGGTPSFTPINGSTADNGATLTSANSCASYDTAGTTASAGTLIFNDTVTEPGNNGQDMTGYDIFIAPGEILTISGTSSSAATMTVAINWSEDN